MAGITETVRRGQLRRWKDVSVSPFTILEVDRTKASWNCKLLRDGEVFVTTAQFVILQRAGSTS